MKRTRLSGLDIAGITLGAVAFIVVIGSIALIAQNRITGRGWDRHEMPGPWDGKPWDGKWSHHGSRQEEKDETIDGSFTAVEIRNIAGSISVHSGDGNGVRIHSVKTAMFPSAMENLTVGIEKQGTTLLIEEKHAGGFFVSAGTISFDVTIPRTVSAIEVHSVSGSITVRDVPSGIAQNLSTISGSITTSRAANLDASSTSGSIQFVFEGSTLAARTVSGSIEGRIGSLDRDGSVSMHTVSGSVGIDTFPGLDAGVSLSSVSGAVSCDLPLTITNQGHNKLEGKVGKGSARLEVTTTSGPITIRKM